jgi:indolepyruvate decarboxylase
MERVIFEAVSQRMPVYVQIPEDYAYMPVIGTPIQGVPFAQTPTFLSDPTELTAALNAILYRLQHARFPVILAAFTIERYGLQKELEALLEATQIHFATTGMSKGLLPESTPLYIGMYNGEFSPIVSGIVKDADLVLDLGGVAFCDGETGEFSDNLDTSKVITVWPDYVEIGSVAEMGGRGEPSYGPIHMKDIFEGLAKQAPRFKKHVFSRPGPLFALEALDDLITKASFFFHLPRFLVPGDVLVVDTGVGDLIATEIPLPDGVQFQHALLWGSIGWGTAAALGVALADPSKRVILVQGDGGHQCTANQIGVMGRYGVNPIILLLNNGIYGVEEVVMGNDKPKNIQEFDKIAPWQYSMIPKAMGCSDWLALSVTKITEFPKVMEQARKYSGAAYIEIHLNPNVLFPALPENIRERLYQTAPPAV